MNYKDKLSAFNATDKYKTEVEFLSQLIGPKPGKVLDYGCGIGTAMDMLKRMPISGHFSGYDVTKFNSDILYVNPDQQWDTVYFMHSLAHIENPSKVIKNLNAKRIIVITPNADWINCINSSGYKPDPTIVKHFNMYRLMLLFGLNGYRIVNSGQFGSVKKGFNERLFLIAEKI